MSPENGTAGARSHRLFFALWPHEARQHAIADQMRSHVASSGGRAIAAANLHVTLVFLGDVAQSRLETAKSCAAAVGDVPSFSLVFDRLDTWTRACVLCLVTEAVPPALAQLVDRLRFKLLSEQFEVQQQEFRPHITLARDVRRRHRERIMPIEWPVERYALVRSRRGPAGSEYTSIAHWVLSPGAEKETPRTHR